MSSNEQRPQDEGEELAHYDDAIVGKAFKYSAAIFLLLVTAAGGLYFLWSRKAPPPPPQITKIDAPVEKKFATVSVPTVKFSDVTSEAGIGFVHNSGALGEKLLPETMGGGVGFFDHDNDGDQDLLFVNGTWWPGKTPAGKSATTSVLYQNDGQGKFTDVTAGSGLDLPIYGMAPAFGDFDGDGLTDVFITAVGENKLFRNLGGGKFSDVTASAGVAGLPNEWSTAAAWLDIDNDGDLDLFVGNYVRWSREIDMEVGYKLVGIGRAYGQPMNFEGTFPYLYRNEGSGKFVDITKDGGLQIKNAATGVPAAKTLGVAPVDVDGDGWMDLVVANDTVQNYLFHNQKNGTFKEMGAIAGVAFDSYGATRGAMGIDTSRFREDGALGIVIGNFANEMTALYVMQGKENVFFTDDAIAEGIGPASRLPLKFGVFFFDYDLDGRLDILSANGHLEEEINQIQKSQQYKQSAQLFWNCGPGQTGCFVPVTPDKAGQEIFKPVVGRGSAYADIDGDGDLDVVITQTGGKPMLLRNDQAIGNKSLRLKLTGSKTNKEAIGAWVRARIGGLDQWRQVMPTRSYLAQSELPVTFGIPKNARVEELEVHWPGGAKQQVAVPAEPFAKITQQ